MKFMKVSLKIITNHSCSLFSFCLFIIKRRRVGLCIIVVNKWNSIELAGSDRLPFRMRPVVEIENTASTTTDVASLVSIGNRPECCCQKANGSVSELAHFIVM